MRRDVIAMLGVAIAIDVVAALGVLRDQNGSRPLGAGPDVTAQPTTAQPTTAQPTTTHVDPIVSPPVQIDIPAVDISAAVDPLGLNADGTLEVPTDYSRAGWYAGLEAPGETGTAVIVAHVDSLSGPAAFHRLSEVQQGTEVAVTRQDGSTVRFIVDRSGQYPKDHFPRIEVYAPADTPALRLITCGGEFDRSSGEYEENIVVYAHAVH